MSIKNKKSPTTAEKLNTVAMQAGLVLMAAATTLGMAELPEHPNKVVAALQPAFVMTAEAGNHSEQSNPIRREKEETGPHYVSYSTTQRTPGRTGRL